ncbi:MAG: Uma2 family endonuclease [Acetobacteraceae bacterium]|nr:Uma2 family endonuclease [Acetobacteraceae bacterium]
MDDVGSTLLARYPAVPRRLLTVDDYHRMGEAGILSEDDRVELIEGELVEMAPIGSEHAASVAALNHLLVLAVGARGLVFPQNPVRLDPHNEPQPDFTVLKPRPDGYRSALPRAEDILLIVEVSASSLGYDRGLKLALYARHRYGSSISPPRKSRSSESQRATSTGQPLAPVALGSSRSRRFRAFVSPPPQSSAEAGHEETR